MACTGKSIIIYGLFGIMIVIPLALLLVAEIAPYFYSSRSGIIKQYNKRANEWETSGINEFKNKSFTLELNGKTTILQTNEVSFGDNYPVRDKCTRKGDPKGGCKTTRAFHYGSEVSYGSNTQATLTIRNAVSGSIIYNETYSISKKTFRTWNYMNCSNYNDCKVICDRWKGTIDLEWKTCDYFEYLSSFCIRVAPSHSGDYETDLPPRWIGSPGTRLAGCEYDKSWNVHRYEGGIRTTMSVKVRSYKDSYLTASCSTEGCSSANNREISCFPTSSDDDQKLAQICFNLTLFSIFFVILDVVILILCVCIYITRKIIIKAGDNRTQLV